MLSVVKRQTSHVLYLWGGGACLYDPSESRPSPAAALEPRRTLAAHSSPHAPLLRCLEPPPRPAPSTAAASPRGAPRAQLPRARLLHRLPGRGGHRITSRQRHSPPWPPATRRAPGGGSPAPSHCGGSERPRPPRRAPQRAAPLVPPATPPRLARIAPNSLMNRWDQLVNKLAFGSLAALLHPRGLPERRLLRLTDNEQLVYKYSTQPAKEREAPKPVLRQRPARGRLA